MVFPASLDRARFARPCVSSPLTLATVRIGELTHCQGCRKRSFQSRPCRQGYSLIDPGQKGQFTSPPQPPPRSGEGEQGTSGDKATQPKALWSPSPYGEQ